MWTIGFGDVVDVEVEIEMMNWSPFLSQSAPVQRLSRGYLYQDLQMKPFGSRSGAFLAATLLKVRRIAWFHRTLAS